MRVVKPPKSRSCLPGKPSLADLHRAVLSDTSLALGRRLRIAAAIKSLARLMGAAMNDVPARPEQLKAAIARAGVLDDPGTSCRWARLRPVIRSGIERWGLSALPGQYGQPLSHGWKAIVDAIPVAHERYLLSRFVRFMSAKGVAPRSVDDTSFEAYHAALVREGLVPRADGDYRRTCQLWNKAAREVRIWPRREVRVPDFGSRYSFPADDLPRALVRQIEGYLARRGDDDPLDTYGASGLRPASVAAIRSVLVRHASILLRCGWKKSEVGSLDQLATLRAVSVSRDYLNSRKPDRSPRVAAQIASVAASIGRNWTHLPDREQQMLDGLSRGLNKDRGGLSSTNLRRANQFDGDHDLRKLLELPATLVRLARTMVEGERSALLVQGALAVEILLNAPLRISQLAQLDAAVDFRDSAGGGVAVTVVENRNLRSRTRQAPLSPECGRLLRLYLARYRPSLDIAGGTALFPGYGAAPKCPAVLARQIKRLGAEHCGLELTPASFRHFAAGHYLARHPGNYRVVAAVLGNTSVESTARTYCVLRAPSAAVTVDSHVDRRKKLPPAEARVRKA